MNATWSILAIYGFILISTNILTWYLSRRWYIKKLTFYKKMVHEEMARELYSDFHDEVGSHLAKILSLAGLLRLKAMDNDQGMYLDRIIESSKALYSGFGAIIRSVQSERTRCRDIYLEISDFGNKLFDSTNVRFYCTIDNQGALRYMYHDSVKDVLLSIRELITNTLKHSKADKVEVDFSIKGAMMFVRVSDNGTGFVPDQSALTGGLNNLKKRSARSNFKYVMKTDQGTTFSLSIPIEHV